MTGLAAVAGSDAAEVRLKFMQDTVRRSGALVQERRLNSERRRAALEHVGLDADDRIATLVVPAQRHGIVTVTPERRRRLQRHVVSMLRSAGPMGEPGEPKPDPPDPTPVGIAACTACQGACCGCGGERAYLTEATMQRVASELRLSSAQMLRRYLASVPREAVRGSCIYQGAQGCTLDRAIRADKCNRYYCAPVRGFLCHAPVPETRDVLVMAVQDDVLRDARVVRPEHAL